MSNTKKLKEAISKFQSGELDENEFILTVVSMARDRSSAERGIEGIMKPFWVHFLRENFEFDNIEKNMRDLKSFLREIKSINHKKGEPNKFWFDEEQLQEMAGDSIDSGLLELERKYEDNDSLIVQVLNKIGGREKPLEFKENKLWSQGFKFSVFDKEYYSQW